MTFLGHKPCGHKLFVNHKDHNRSNNHIDNLEVITQRQNTNLKHRPHSSKYTGVVWNKLDKIWHARISVNGKYVNLGNHKDEFQAHLAYEAKLKELEISNP